MDTFPDDLTAWINPIDPGVLRERVRHAAPFPNFCQDNFLRDTFATEVLAAYPSYAQALKEGKSFSAVNEKGKVQVTDAAKFAAPVAQLNTVLAAPAFLNLLSHVFDIPHLQADAALVGGGIHQTGPRGHLDVHVDFNYMADRQLHRRLNILIYFNQGWPPEWGGNIELWDKDVKTCPHSFSPIFNRCVVFETNEISYHGVTAVQCPADQSRKSFAAYYYTREAPAHWTGESHSTLFKARPDEKLKAHVLVPAERTKRWMVDTARKAKRKITGH